MLNVGLTGGIACGKTLAGRFLLEAGIHVIDADDLAHSAIGRGGPAYQAVVDAFGSRILDAGGAIDRRRLGAIVFGDSASRERLNAIVHPHVNAAWRQWLRERAASGEWMAVVIIPLLFEVGLDAGWDAVICVKTPPEIQRERLAARGLTQAEVELRLAAQMPIQLKASKSEFVVDNTGTEAQLREQMLAIVAALAERTHGRA